ncbi:MAG TPA: YARHG domain-containing protein [Mucilaginibacter sp.]|jgi:hypothetical protein|nr:YARHG domain-containing protein [Mucilaginibacter sp.]
MKQFICIACLGAVLYLQSCGGSLIKNKDNDQTSSTGVMSNVPVPVATDNKIIGDEKDLTGYWVGEFGPDVTPGDSVEYESGEDEEYNTINISIDEINGNKVNGHTVIAGKVRFFKCNMKKAGSKYQFTFKGRADEKAPGTYKFSIAKGDSLLKGRWDAGDKIPSHTFALVKNLFKYDPNWKLAAGRYVDYNKGGKVTIRVDSAHTYENDGFSTTSDDVSKHNASAELLTKDYLANLKKGDLLVLRNSIFARHGYTFKKPQINLYFSQQPWYVPLNTDVTAELTPIEKQNIALMVPYEKNAKEYYDAFGR